MRAIEGDAGLHRANAMIDQFSSRAPLSGRLAPNNADRIRSLCKIAVGGVWTFSLMALAPAALLAQGGFSWVQSPVNGHWYARIAPSTFDVAASIGDTQLASLATIRNAPENTWIVNNMLFGQEAWINMACGRSWLDGWPVDYVPGGDSPDCNGGCNNPNTFCAGINDCFVGNPPPNTWGCRMSDTRYFVSPDSNWYRRHRGSNHYAIIEHVVNDPYTWSSLSSPASPSPRRSAAITFDSDRQQTIYFGGFDGALRNDTWEWTPQGGWAARLTVVNPPVRHLAAMTYDSSRNNTVLFGGRGSVAALGDTWIWNGATWAQPGLATAPSPRQGHAMAFDQSRGRVVLFGGTTDVNANGNNQTWEFDGLSWSQVATSSAPSGRWGHAMFYDPTSQRVVLFGGRTSAGASNETWTFDGATWTLQVLSVTPPARYEMASCFDSSRQRGVICGGWNDSSNMDDVWAYLGFNWYKLHTATRPAGRRQAAASFHSDRVHLLGGFSNTVISDPWIGRIGPSVRLYGSGCGSPALAVQADPATSPAIGTTFGLTVSGITATSFFSLMAIGFSKTAIGAFSLPLPLDGIGMPGCWLYNDTAHRLGEFCTPTGAASSRFDLALPLQPTLVGLHVYFQPWTFDPTANPTGVLTGNGADVTLGSN